jgi:hypothetical protein
MIEKQSRACTAPKDSRVAHYREITTLTNLVMLNLAIDLALRPPLKLKTPRSQRMNELSFMKTLNLTGTLTQRSVYLKHSRKVELKVKS